jgi:flagellar basal body rod protein FlgG
MSFYTSLTWIERCYYRASGNIEQYCKLGNSRIQAVNLLVSVTFSPPSPLQRAAAVVGQGVALKEVAQEFSQGFVQFSANSLDLAITGDGFFPLQSS